MITKRRYHRGLLHGLLPFSAGIDASTASHCVVEDVHVRYPFHEMTVNGYSIPSRAGCILGENNVWRNNSVSFSSESGLLINGSGNRIEGSIFHDIGYAMGPSAGIVTGTQDTASNIITSNTVYRTVHFGVRHNGMAGGEISHNDIREVCLAVDDCGPTYAWGTDGQGTEIAYNVVSVNRGDTTFGIYLDDGSRGHVVHHNLVLAHGIVGIGVKGPNDILNNTILPSGSPASVGGPPIQFVPAPPWYQGVEVTDLSGMTVANNLIPLSPNLHVTLITTYNDVDAYFNAAVVGKAEYTTYTIPLADFALQSQSDPAVLDLADVHHLTFAIPWREGAFEARVDDVALVRGDGGDDLVLDDFDDLDDESLISASWWAGGGEGSTASLTFETDGDRSVAVFEGDQVPDGWQGMSLDISSLDLTEFEAVRFTARTTGTLRITSPDGDPTIRRNLKVRVIDCVTYVHLVTFQTKSNH